MKPALHLVTTPPAPANDARELLLSAIGRLGLRHLLQLALDAATLAGEHGDATPDQCLTAHAAGDLLRDALEACGPRRAG